MSNPRGPEWSDPTQGAGGYPPNADPAYSGYWGPPTGVAPSTGAAPTAWGGPAPYGAPANYGEPSYGVPGTAGYGFPPTQPTQQLPPYWQQPGTGGYPTAAPPPPEPPKKPSRWLWGAAIAAVMTVTGLVLALVIVSNSSKDSTVVAPPSSTTTTPPRLTTTAPTRPPTRTSTPTNTAAPVPLPVPTETLEPTDTLKPTESLEPTEPGIPSSDAPAPAGTEAVVYNVTGEGRAINITYVDNGGIMQTEFNVVLPWSKTVSLAAPAKTSASVAVVNIGRDVTCSVSVNGAQVRQRTGQGLTICTGAA